MVGAENYERHLRAIRDLLEGQGVLVSSGFPSPDWKESNVRLGLRHVVDFSRLFSEAGWRPSEYLLADDGHLNAAGHRFLAGRLSAYFLEHVFPAGA